MVWKLAPLAAVAARAAAVAVICGFGQVAPVAAEPMQSPSGGEVLAFGDMKVSRWIVEAVVSAARATTVDPAYLMALADKESSLVPGSRARTSSAEGLFQFLEATWLEVVCRHGAKHGYAEAADAIQEVQGRPSVVDETMRQWILGLRRDSHLSALMAGEMVRTHRETLAGKVAREPSPSELYLAHFLGAMGASRLLELVDGKSDHSAPEAFPAAAKANPAIFFKTVTSVERITVNHLKVDVGRPAPVTAAMAGTAAPVTPPKRPALNSPAPAPALKTASATLRAVPSSRPSPIIQVSAPVGARKMPVIASRERARSVVQPAASVTERVVSRLAPRTVAELKIAFASMIDRRVARYANVMATLGPAD